MTEKQLQQLADDPKQFLKRCLYHEQRITFCVEQIQHYRDIATSITQEIKEITTFSLTPSHKVENCVLEITELEEEIKAEISRLRRDIATVQEAIDFTDDELTKSLLQARYLSNMPWEEIAVHLNISYRWTLRLHGKALEALSEKAKNILKSHVNSLENVV